MNKPKIDTGRYVSADGIVRWKQGKFSKAELARQREEFSKSAKAGKIVCLTDLLINHGH